MRLRVFHLSVCLLLMLTSPARAGDIPKSADHPLIKRYEGSTIIRYEQKAFNAYQLVVGPLVGRGSDAHFPKVLKPEGRVTRITYLVPAGRSPLEVFRNYDQDLKKAGFTTLFTGAHEALGQGPDDTPFPETKYADVELPGEGNPLLSAVASTNDQFLAAKLARPEGDIHIALYAVAIGAEWGKYVYANPPDRKKTAVDGQVIVQLDIVDAKPMETKMVTVSAGEMATDIAKSGSVALYGILFDTGSAVVKAESMPTLEEVAKLLKTQPTLRLLVVGHTDNVGTFESNMDLSQRRAAAVVQMLTSKFALDPKRLKPVGVSFASPVASNGTEEGRSKNRRVQLVENISSSAQR